MLDNRRQVNAQVILFFLITLSNIAIAPAIFANTAIETETAQIGKKGDIGFSQSVELEKGPDGKAAGTLTQLEYGISDRAEILIEPFFQLWEMPNDGPAEHGAGDLEITPSYMVATENGLFPAVLVAFKVKVPTGAKNVGGTGKYDYYPYLIFGQHAGGWTINANLGVNFATPEESGPMEKTTVWDFEIERDILPKTTLFLETFSAEDGVTAAATAIQYQFSEHFSAFTAFSYTEEHAYLVRPGINLDF